MSTRKGLPYLMKQHLKKTQKNAVTRTAYKKHINKFCDYIKSQNITSRYVKDNPIEIIQKYTDFLISKNLSADTIHTYIAFPCKYFRIKMKEIDKPKRSASQNKKSRGDLNKQGDKEKVLPEFDRLVKFQAVVGLRRAELKRLQGNNLVFDESGHPCIEVVKGKGGKYHLQRVAKNDINFVKTYFDGSSNKLFSDDEMKNKIDLHGMRAEHAREMYRYYLEVCKDPNLYQKLRSQLIARFKEDNHSHDGIYRFIAEMDGTYKLRGEVAKRARALDRPTEYNKTALMAVSVFHLSHWRNDVTARNYML